MHDSKLIQTGTPEKLILNPKNSIVSNLVEADRKFRHIESLKVKDLMTPILSKYLYEYSIQCLDALDRMMNHDVKMAVIVENGSYQGIVTIRELYQFRNSNLTLSEVSKNPPVFLPEDSAMAALTELKKNGLSFAPVMDNGVPSGFIIPDEVMMNLI